MGRRPADRCDRGPVHCSATCGARADRVRRHMSVVRVLRPATQDLAMLTRSGAIAADAAALLDKIIAGRLAFLVSGGTGAGKTTLLSAALGEVSPRRTHRLRGGRRRVGAATSTPGEARRAMLEYRRRRRDHGSGPGEAGAADAPGPHRRRRGSRRRGGRSAGRAQHRPRRGRGDRAREQPGRGARPARGARIARRP